MKKSNTKEEVLIERVRDALQNESFYEKVQKEIETQGTRDHSPTRNVKGNVKIPKRNRS